MIIGPGGFRGCESSIIIITAGLVPRSLDKTNITIPCKALIGIPFLFSFCSQILWTLISLYRLFLVIRSVRGDPPATRSIRSKITKTIPASALLLSLLSACLASYFSEPFLLYRLCMGSCDQFNIDDEWVAVYYSVIPALVLYLPAGTAYAAIFMLVHHASKKQKCQSASMSESIAMAGVRQSVMFTVTTDPASLIESTYEESSTITLQKRTLMKQHRNSLNQITPSDSSDAKVYSKHIRMSQSLPDTSILPRAGSVARLQSRRTRSKLARRNIISAKLSFLVMVLLFLAGAVLSVTYNQVKDVQVYF